jgi:1,4-dihydroxy-2-naphthoate octaprenyltransferase
MLKKSTIRLLRFHFSFFLMPVFWFALSQTKIIDVTHAVLSFIILHLLVYPASNGYNSYMDRDTTSIGGLEHPDQPTRQLFYVTLIMDLLAIAASFFISYIFGLGILFYILASRAYSWRKIRLKKYPVPGYLTVIICQGGLIFFLVMHAVSTVPVSTVPLTGMITACLLIGGFYPLTQIYQHEADRADDVTTLSYKLGYKGTFLFCAIVYAAAIACLFSLIPLRKFIAVQFFLLPVTGYFLYWMSRVFKSASEANFRNTMMMNLIATICSNIAFIYLFYTL